MNPTVEFNAKLFPKLGKSDENSFHSMTSVQIALGMITAGASGKTLEQLSALEEIPANQQEQTFQELIKSFSDEKKCELKVANAVWLQNDVEFQEQFEQKTQEVFQATAERVDYKSPEKTCSRINEWCDQNTNGKIKKILNQDDVCDDTVLVLTNAIYFKGKWLFQFKKENTKPANFRSPKGKTEVPMMHLNAEAGFMENEQFQALELLYEGKNLAMLIVLPKEDSTAALEENLAEVYEEAATTVRLEEKVVISLPKFKLETEYRMANILKEEAPLAFSDKAEFTGITVNAKDACKISEVIHKGFVAVDEEGTEAAAVTAVVGVRCVSVRRTPTFTADHPFLFFIHNPHTNTILFAGRVVKP